MARSRFRETICRGLWRRLASRVTELGADELSRSAVVFSPHQDDETLGCGGTIIKKKQAGADLTLVFMTDGATSHQRFVPPGEMKAIRRHEALGAAAVLGVDEESVHFLEYRNRGLDQQSEAAAADVLAVLQERQPQEVFIPYHREAPRDHRAANRIVRDALHRYGARATVHEYPIWYWQHWPWSRLTTYAPRSGPKAAAASLAANRHLLQDFRYGVAITDVLELKRTALAKHWSQVARLVVDPRWRILADVSDGEWLDCFFGCYELYYDYTVGRS